MMHLQRWGEGAVDVRFEEVSLRKLASKMIPNVVHIREWRGARDHMETELLA